MGSSSDSQLMAPAELILKNFGVGFERKVLSAHRNPEAVADFAKKAKGNGVEVILAGAGKAAHLPGAIASYTSLPVIGVPIESGMLGLDALLSIVQMPGGIPVATVGINNSKNAALLAIQILALHDPKLAKQLTEYRKEQASPKKQQQTKQAERPIIDG